MYLKNRRIGTRATIRTIGDAGYLTIVFLIICGFAAICPASASAQSPSGFDGFYKGENTLIPERSSTAGAAAGGAACNPRSDAKLQITGGHLVTLWGFGGRMEGSVGADGSISIFAPNSGGGARLTAAIQGRDLSGTLLSGQCTYTVHLAKQ
jgi:hypothetical protein